jgi:hypothetical protein
MKTYLYFVHLKHDDTLWQTEIYIEYKHMTQNLVHTKTHSQNTIKTECFVVKIMPRTTHYTIYISQHSSVIWMLFAVVYIQRTLRISYITVSLTLWNIMTLYISVKHTAVHVLPTICILNVHKIVTTSCGDINGMYLSLSSLYSI